MATAGGLHIIVRIDRSRLHGVMGLGAEDSQRTTPDDNSSHEEDDDADAQVSKIKKKKISPSTLLNSVKEDNDGDFVTQKIKKMKKNSSSGPHHSGEKEDDGVKIKKSKKKTASEYASHDSHKKTHRADGLGGLRLKKEKAVPRDSDGKKEEKEKIKEALQKRCVVKIEKQATILARSDAVAAGDGPGEVRCVYCSRSFRTEAGMKVHRTRIHFQKEGNAPWCLTCHQVFQDVKKLNRHSKRCAGMRKDVLGTGEHLPLQRTPAGFLVPSPRGVIVSTPREERPAGEVSDELHQGGVPQPAVVVPKYQFTSPAPPGMSPARVTVAEAKEKEKHISFGREGTEETVESPARSPRRKNLRPRKVAKSAPEPDGDNAEWEGANASFWQDGERRVQPSRSAKSAVESYCECSKSGPEDSQDCTAGKAQAPVRCGAHGATGDGDVVKLGGQWTSAASGIQTSIPPSSGQHQTEEDGRGVVAIDIRPKKKETVKSRQTVLVCSNRPSPVGDFPGESVAGGRMKSRISHAVLSVDKPNREATRVLVQKNCLPVTEMVRMSMIPSARRDERNRQEAGALHGGNRDTLGLYTHFYLSANKQSLSRHVSHPNNDTNDSGNETGSPFEKTSVEDGELQSPLNSTPEMSSLENEYRKNSTDRTKPIYICQKPPLLRDVKGDTVTLLKINKDAPLNLSTHTPADGAANCEPSNLNEKGAAPHREENNNELCDKLNTCPVNGNSPHCSDLQEVDGHPNKASHDTIQSSKDVHTQGTAPTDSVRDAVMDLRKISGKSPAVNGGTEEVVNNVSPTISSNCDLRGGPTLPPLKLKAGEICDATEVEANRRPSREDILETDAVGSVSRPPSRCSESVGSVDPAVLDSVCTQASSADDEASDGSDTETCDERFQVWSPECQSENCEMRSATLYPVGPVSSTSVCDNSSSISEIFESTHRSPESVGRAEREAGGKQSSSSGRHIPGDTSGPSHDEQIVRLHTADSTAEDPVVEESNVTHPLSLTQSPRGETSQSRLVGGNIVEDVEIRGVDGENPSNTLEEGKPSKLRASTGDNVPLVAHCSPNDSKINCETNVENEWQEATLPCIVEMKKICEAIPKPSQSPLREWGTRTEDQKARNPGVSGETADQVTHSQESVPLFLAPITVPRAPTPGTVSVAKDLSEYEASNSSTFAENINRTLDSPATAISCTDLHGEELSQNSLTDTGSVLRNASEKTGFPIIGGSSSTRGTVDTVANGAVRAQGVIVGTHPRAKSDARSGATADSWLQVSPLHYGIQRVLCSSPKSPLSPLSTLVTLDCLRSPQSDSESKGRPPSPTGELRSPARPLVDDVGVSGTKLPPFATLTKASAETKRPNRPCSLPVGVTMDLTQIKQNDDETRQLDAVPAQRVNASLSTGTGNKETEIESKACSKLPECSSPRDDELCILYEHRPEAINLSLQDRPSSAPLAKSDQKGQPNTGSFPPRPSFESNQKGTPTRSSDGDQCVYQEKSAPQGFLGSGGLQGPLAAAIHPALQGGSPSKAAVKNPSHSNPQQTQYKGDLPHQGMTRGSWPVFRTGQVYQQNQAGSGSTMHGVIVQGTVTNADTTNTAFKNASQTHIQDISSVAGGAATVSRPTWEADNQNITAQGGQSTLPNLPDIIGCKMSDNAGNKQTEVGSSGISADSWTTRRAASGRRGRGGRRDLSDRDDQQPCECPCGKVCKNPRGLEQHKGRAHRDIVFFRGDGGDSCGSWPHVLGARSFRCPCGARFVRLDAIKKHFVAEQAKAGERRWWITDRVPICTCRQADRGAPPHSSGYLRNHCGAGLTSELASDNAYTQETWLSTALRHQSTPGQPKQVWPSAVETRGAPTSGVHLLRSQPSASYADAPAHYGGDNNPVGSWATPFPVSGPPSQSAVSVIKSAQTTGRHCTVQKAAGEWWSPAAEAQNSAAQLPSPMQMLAGRQDSSNVARNPAEHYNLSGGVTREVRHTVPTLSARPRETAVTRTGANAESVRQFAVGDVGGWSHKYGPQTAEGSWAFPVAPLGGASATSTQQHNKYSTDQGYHHTPQLGIPSATASRQGQQNTNIETPALGNVVGGSRPGPQRWNFRHPTSPALFSAAQPGPNTKLPFTRQEFSSPQQNADTFHWGAGVTLTASASHGRSGTSAMGGQPLQPLQSTEYLGAGTGFEVTLPPAPTQTSAASAPQNVVPVAATKDDPKWKMFPNSKNRED